MSNVRLGLDLFSVRSQGWNAFQFLDYAVKLGVELVHFSEQRFLGSLDDAHLRQVRDYAAERKLSLEVGMTSICPTSKRFNPAAGTAEEQLTAMFRVARATGSPLVRCFLGSSQDRPIEPHIPTTVKVLRAVKSRCQDAGLKIAIENHAGDMQARELKTLIEEAGRDFVGACLDSGNPVWAIEDPHLSLETLHPYVLTTHVRDSAVWEDEKGIGVVWTAMGEGTVGIDRWVKRFAELCPGKPLSLEIIVTRQPRYHNYLDPKFWDAFPATPGWEFARFLKLARQGSPRIPTDTGEIAPLERSARYCKDLLK
jgi:sugar phosphate isomerase/epimerase